MTNLNIPSKITNITSNFLEQKSVNIFLKRDDLIHNIVSGNKWRKLKYNFEVAHSEGYRTILSFGGAYSNHLHALSYAAHINGFNSIGVIRGEKHKNINSTLSFCQDYNMLLHYIKRHDYRLNKYSEKFKSSLKEKFGDFFLIPEGGNNLLGVKGCEEILQEVDITYDYVCCPVGSGCTISGLIRSMNQNTHLLGFCPFSKVEEQRDSIISFCSHMPLDNWELIPDYEFGGFGKINSNLIKFVRQFKIDYSIELDLLYMGKLFYFLFDLINKGCFRKKSRILILHTGGLQGLNGFNFKY